MCIRDWLDEDLRGTAALGRLDLGGRRQLHIGNDNLQDGLISITQANFHYSTGAAISLLPPNNTTAGFFKGSFSTQVIIRECKFLQNDQVLVNWADWTSMTDCTIDTSPFMDDKAVLEKWVRCFSACARVLDISVAAQAD